MGGAEFLQRFHPSEVAHGPPSSSQGLVRILHAVVQPAPGLLPIGGADLLQSGPV
jgi:hypothetical protein